MKDLMLEVKLENRPSIQLGSLTFNAELSLCKITISRSEIQLVFPENKSALRLKMKEQYSINIDSLKEWNSNEWVDLDDSSRSFVCHGRNNIRIVIRFRLTSQSKNYILTKTVETLPTDIAYEFRCKKCHTPVVKDGLKLRRVLPLPSENWQSSQELWFCHKHDQEKPTPNKSETPMEVPAHSRATILNQELEHACQNKDINFPRTGLLPKDLLPTQNDMFYSISKLMLHIDALSTNLKDSCSGSAIVCSTCRSIVGQVDSDQSFYLYRMNVDMQDRATSKIINPQTPFSLIARIMREQIVYGNHCRLVLFSESSMDTLLIWMLESDVQVFQEKLFLRDNQNSLSNVEFEQCHHVLFKCTERSSSLVQDWLSELTVCSHSILQGSLETIRNHLRQSKDCFVFSELNETIEEGFDVGFITIGSTNEIISK